MKLSCYMRVFVCVAFWTASVLVFLNLNMQYPKAQTVYGVRSFLASLRMWNMEHRPEWIQPCNTTPAVYTRIKDDESVTNTTSANRTYVNLTAPTWNYLHDHIHTNLPGGHFRPITCTPQHKVAVLVPYRDRMEHLRAFLQHMHPFLQRQQIEYRIFVIEQAPGDLFNRGMLINVGFVQSLKSDNFTCFILHDVDLLPEDNRNMYVCGTQPVHMATARSNSNYSLPYGSYYGGVSAMSRYQYEKVNGFSNVYFGWGAEDDDLYRRIAKSKMTVMRYSKEIGRYQQMVHKRATVGKDRLKYLQHTNTRATADGLNSLKYYVIRHEERPLYTWILMSVNKTEILNPWTKSRTSIWKKQVPQIKHDVRKHSTISRITTRTIKSHK